MIKNFQTIIEAHLPKGITHIDDSAFLECTGLTNLSLLNSVKNIGNYAFDGCSNLKRIIAPQQLVDKIKAQAPDFCKVISHQEEQR